MADVMAEHDRRSTAALAKAHGSPRVPDLTRAARVTSVPSVAIALDSCDRESPEATRRDVPPAQPPTATAPDDGTRAKPNDHTSADPRALGSPHVLARSTLFRADLDGS